MSNNKKEVNIRRDFLLSVVAIFVFLGLLEGSARLFIYFTRGSSTVGTHERTAYLRYQPFVMFGPNWDETLDPDRHKVLKENAGVFRILLLGGSTAANFPTALLERAFYKKFPTVKFEVINAAAGGYNSRQELIVAAIWGPSLRPDMIITLDGANDLIHRLRMDKAGTFYLNPAYEFIIKRPLLAPFVHLMSKSQLIQGIFRMRERMNVGSANHYMDAVPVYISAQHSINLLARATPAIRIMVLQPWIGFKQPRSIAETHFRHYDYREPVIRELYQLLDEQLKTLSARDRVLYVDARFIFNGLSHTVFSDDLHFVNEEGYRVLAGRIVDAVDYAIIPAN